MLKRLDCHEASLIQELQMIDNVTPRHAVAGEGGYQFGTTFLLTAGAGVRYTPDGKRWQYRIEVHDYISEVSYPTTYTDKPPGGASGILPPGSSRAAWRHSWNLQIGAAYTFLR